MDMTNMQCLQKAEITVIYSQDMLDNQLKPLSPIAHPVMSIFNRLHIYLSEIATKNPVT